jgi:hypothetical protein
VDLINYQPAISHAHLKVLAALGEGANPTAGTLGAQEPGPST